MYHCWVGQLGERYIKSIRFEEERSRCKKVGEEIREGEIEDWLKKKKERREEENLIREATPDKCRKGKEGVEREGEVVRERG